MTHGPLHYSILNALYMEEYPIKESILSNFIQRMNPSISSNDIKTALSGFHKEGLLGFHNEWWYVTETGTEFCIEYPKKLAATLMSDIENKAYVLWLQYPPVI